MMKNRKNNQFNKVMMMTIMLLEDKKETEKNETKTQICVF